VPDYTVSEDGVKVAEVRTGTPAAEAGLRPGDIISALNATPVHNLREYTQVLKELDPGAVVEILFRRNENEYRATTRVIAR
jgi:S1-C subfamily serine protease